MKPQTSYDAAMEQEAKASRQQIEAAWAQMERDRQAEVGWKFALKLFVCSALGLGFVFYMLWIWPALAEIGR